MKERPILFSGAMVRALLEGRKTQTRRVVKPQPPAGYEFNGTGPAPTPMPGRVFVSSPYGQPGDGLWVRETWAHVPVEEGMGYIYRADGDDAFDRIREGWDFTGPWKPSIFCKREASRITLEITGIRAERLQDISEADAMAEGVDPGGPVGHIPSAFAMGRARYQYATLWDTINGAGAWDKNPWVWVVEFKGVPRMDGMDRMD